MEPLAEIRDGRRPGDPGPLPVAALAGALPDALLADIAAEVARAGWLDPHAPGRVYEAWLARDRTGRRAGGAYYTPPALVDFVVQQTLGRVLAPGVRIIDPACGGGAFLVGALAAGARGADLVGVDIDPIAADVCRLALAMAGAPEATVITGDALGDAIDGAFDVVIGNPPWGQKGLKYPPDEAARLRARYRTARGVLDPFKLFVERAIELAGESGRWGLVLPDIVLLKNQQPLRELILERCALEWIVHAGRAFPDVNLDVAVLVARGGRPAAPVRIWHSLPETWREAPPPEHALDQRCFEELPAKRFNIYLTAADRDWVGSLASLPRLGDWFEIHEGVHTGNAREVLIRDARESDDAVPIVIGRRELQRYRLAWGGAWLHPGALDRAAGHYGALGRPEWHEAGKIVVRRTGDHVVAAVDTTGTWITNNAFVVVPRAPMSVARLRAVVGVLNSGFMTRYFRTVQPRTGRLFAELKINHLAAFPLPNGDINHLARLVEPLEHAAAGGTDDPAAADALDAAVEQLYAPRPISA
ncbi:MAG TPA: N-6 DNA methylase [Kofleriaceae bacterium]|nr:N-6 DNA methylase [Kofleriaceae bacterium]